MTVSGWYTGYPVFRMTSPRACSVTPIWTVGTAYGSVRVTISSAKMCIRDSLDGIGIVVARLQCAFGHGECGIDVYKRQVYELS